MLESLVREAESSPEFRERCRHAAARGAASRRRAYARPLDDEDVKRVIASEASRSVSEEISRRLQQ